MPAQYDPYDPEEIRRRQMFSTDVMSPDTDETEDQTSLTGSGVTTAPSSIPTQSVSLTPAQQKYKNVIDQYPDEKDYQPSKWRRFGAAVAGGLAGLKDAKTGYNIGRTIASQPYDEAMSDWQHRVKASALDVGLDKDVAAQDIARRRAGAYERSASARERAASATESWRKTEEANQPWRPKTKEETLELERAKHTPTRPSNIEYERKWMQDDPAGYQRYKQLSRAPSRTMEEEKELREYTQKMQAKYRRPTQPRVVLPATPGQQAQAEILAARQLARENPEYAAFFEDAGTKSRIKGVDEVGSSAGGGFLGLGVDQEKASLARAAHQHFLSKVRQRAQAIIGSRSSGGDDWEVQQDDQEEEQ